MDSFAKYKRLKFVIRHKGNVANHWSYSTGRKCFQHVQYRVLTMSCKFRG